MIPIVSRIIHSIGTFFRTLKWLFVAHLNACFEPYDPIIEAPEWITTSNLAETLPQFRLARERSARTLHRLYIFPFFVMVLFALDYGWIMYQHNFDYFNDPMPELLTHKMFPEMFKAFGDQIVWAVVVACLITFYHCWRHDFLNERYVMYVVKNDDDENGEAGGYSLIVNGQVWDQEDGDRIIAMWRKTRVQVRYAIAFFQMIITAYYNIHYIAKPITNWKHYLTWFLYYQEFLWYCPMVVVYVFCQFFIATKYLLIRQKFILSKQTELLEKIWNKSDSFYADWRQYLLLNTYLAYQCNEVRAYNKFWSIILTALFASYMMLICYFSYCCLYFANYTFTQVFYFLFFMFELSIMIFATIYRCSRVDENNDHSYLLNMKTCVLIQLRYTTATARQLANIHKIATNRNFSKSCFRLSNGYRLDSSAFNLAVYIQTSLFLMLVKRA